MKTNIETLTDEISKIENEPLDAIYFLDTALLKISIKELISYKLSPGDVSLNAKARWVLETGAKHIAEGRPSPEFLQFIAYSISKTLNKAEPSLDHAFRLKARKQRPTTDRYADPAINEYLNVMAEYTAVSHETSLTVIQIKKALRQAKRNAMNRAYKVRYGETPQEHLAKGINPESIKGRERTIREAITALGHY